MKSLAIETLFGLPLAIDRQDAMSLQSDLTALLAASVGEMPSHSDELPELLVQLFTPKSRESTLRRALSEVQQIERTEWSIFLRPPLAVDVGPRRRIPTIEGLAVWNALTLKLREPTELVTFSAAEVAGIATWVAEQYRVLSLERFNTVVKYLRGEGPLMGLPAAGLLIVLLVNRNDHPDRKLDRTGREKLDELIAGPIERFAEAIKKGKRDPRHFGLYSGYSLTEATRRLGESVLRQDSNWVYIDPEHREHVIEVLGRELARRSTVDEAQLIEAIDSLVAAYRDVAGDLARLASAHEDAGATRRTASDLLEAFREARSQQ